MDSPAPPIPPRVTRADILAQEARVRTLVDECISSILSLQPDDSSVHNVVPYYSGFRIRIDVATEYLDIYAIPWARGWSVFTEDTGCGPVGAYSWRDVPRRLQGLQRPVYAPRDVIGPDNIPAASICDAVLYIVDKLTRLRDLRRRRIEAADRRAQTWYWPRAAAKAHHRV